MRRLIRYGVIVAAGVIAAGCTAGSQSTSSSGSGNGNGGGGGKATGNSTLTISNESGQLWSCGFNPLNPSDTGLSVGFIYEPLVYVNPLQQGKTTPMLASSYQWSNGNKTLGADVGSGGGEARAGSAVPVTATPPRSGLGVRARARTSGCRKVTTSGTRKLRPCVSSPGILSQTDS